MENGKKSRTLRLIEHPRSHAVIFVILGALVIASCAALFYVWSMNKELAALKPIQPVVFYTIPEQYSFLDTDGTVDYQSGEVFETEKKRLIGEHASFIELNLKNMELTLYEDGKLKEHFPIKAKGKEGSWWETTTGVYSVGTKTVNHFSSISKVWMPYGIQFYGNFFIHGWPYYADGTPLPFTSSGGCIRLLTEDAKKVFEFAKPGMPVLVFEEKTNPFVYQALRPRGEPMAPAIESLSALVADLDTGEILLSKNADTIQPIGGLVKLMTALTASEVVDLDKHLTVRSYMISEGDSLFKPNIRYRGFDLLYPLLMQSSETAATVLSAFLGEGGLVAQMNKKAKGLGMRRTVFVDTTGKSDENIAPLTDLAKLAKYILEKRSFVFGTSRGRHYEQEKDVVFSGIKNLNPLADESGLIGVASGKVKDSGEALLTVWRTKTAGGVTRYVLLLVLGSKDSASDTLGLLEWVRGNFELK